MKWYTVVLRCVYLKANDIEYLFKCFWPFVCRLWGTVDSNPLPILKLSCLFIGEF